jgi:hypothetical protein
MLPLLWPASVVAASMEEFGDWAKGIPVRFFRRIKAPEQQITSPEQLQKVLDEAKSKTFDANPAQRDEKSSWERPAKQVSLAVMDGQIQILRRFLSFQAADSILKTGSAITKSAAWQTSKKVISKMTGDSATVLNGTLAHSDFGRKFFALLAKDGVFSKAILRESNFVLMALINVLIISGIYDGLDLDTVKDNVVAIAPLATDWTYDEGLPTGIVTDFINRQLYSGFNGTFDTVYKRALNSQNVWGNALKSLDTKADALGQKLFKATRTGAEIPTGKSLSEKLGLVGVGEGMKFTLSGLVQRLVVGGAYAIAGDFVIESTFALMRGFQNRVTLGGNRDKYWARQDLNSHQKQVTGNKWLDGWRERTLRLGDVVEKRIKWPVSCMTVPVTTLLGGYLGSVIAGALFIGGGAIPLVGGALISSLFAGIGNYVGNWGAVKIDRSPWMMNLRHKNYVKRIISEIKEMPDYRNNILSDADAQAIANERADDFAKIEAVGQVSSNIFIVDHPYNILMGKKGSYWKMVINNENGSNFEGNANIQYDVIDLDGYRWVYDLHTNKIRNVGKVSLNNGRNIVFVNSQGVLIEDDVIVNKEADDETRTLHIFQNGLILEKRLDEEWVIRGQSSDRDLLFRDTGERFQWEDGAYRRTNGPGKAGIVMAADTDDPLSPYMDLVNMPNDEEFMAELRKIRDRQIADARTQLFRDLDSPEELDARVSDLVSIAVELGIVDSEDSVDENVLNALGSDSPAIQNMLKGRAERFIAQKTQDIDDVLEDTSVADIRATLQRMKTEYPIDTKTSSVYQSLGSRYLNAPVWGPLSVLSDSNAVLAIALMSNR